MTHTNKYRLSPIEWYAVRWAVLRRDKFQCQYCGQFAPNVKLEVDHIIPIAEGGTNAEDNLKTACFACNRGKGTLWLIERSGKQPVASGGERESYPKRDTTAFLILKELGENPGLTTRALITRINRKDETVRTVLFRLRKREQVRRERSPEGLKWFLLTTPFTTKSYNPGITIIPGVVL